MSQARIRTLILVVTLVLIAIIPSVTFALSQNFRSNISARTNKYTRPVTNNSGSPSSTLADDTTLQEGVAASGPGNAEAASPSPSSTPEVSFGPTLNLRIKIDGRPANDQSDRVFVGLAQGQPSSNPSYLLSFTIDVPSSGEYKGLSLAGLTVGSTYTAYVKGKAQVSTSSAFLMRPAQTDLNNGQALFLTTGDLNEDNVINQADYNIEKVYLGSTVTSSNWFPDGDFNKDGVINLVDLAIISKNMAKVGSTGPVQSTTSTGSAVLVIPPSVGAQEATKSIVSPGGYWLWVPH